MDQMTDKKPQLEFPKRFLWGAATSAHQVEGNTHNQWTVWELENAKALAAASEYHFKELDTWENSEKEAKSPSNYVSGKLADHYNRYEEDFDLLTDLNMNSFRFSVEWSRIEPEENAWNVEAIEHYKRYVAELKKRGIEPVVTLFHYTLPVWFANRGGFEKKSNVKFFTRFAQKIIGELGSDVRLIITINEAEIYAYESYMSAHYPPAYSSKRKFIRVVKNLAYAHNQTSKMLHKMNRRYKVSIADNSAYFYAGDDSLLSRRAADFMQFWQDDYFLRKVIKTCDFLGVNYYFSNRVYGYRIHNANEQVSDSGFDLTPADIQYCLERLHDKYHLPILITENGLADSTDDRRRWWITQTVLGMQRAMAYGVDLMGYMHWSLVDNFEWDKGKWPRYGLVHIDYETGKRTPRPSAIWFGNVIKKLRGTAK
jgi:beta-glucosidase